MNDQSAGVGPEWLRRFGKPAAVLTGLAVVAAVGLVLTAVGRGPGAAAPSVTAPRILSWNVQNLFDDRADGGEYAEFAPARVPGDAAAWTSEKYRARLKAAASVIGQTAGLPEVVVLVEIESAAVLDDLAGLLPVGAYPHRLAQEAPGSPVRLGVLSRLPLLGVRSHAYRLGNGTARPVWELGIALPDGCTLRLFANHWKSQAGDDPSAGALRRLAAAALDREAALPCPFLVAEGHVAVTVACGDFNEAPAAAAVGAGVRGAVRESGGRTPGLARAGRLAALRSVGEGLVRLPAGGLWRHFWDQPDIARPGSYYFAGAWEGIDSFMLPRAGDGKADGVAQGFSFTVLCPPEGLDAAGLPRRYDPARGRGLSDHLPLLLGLPSGQAGPGQGQSRAGSSTARTAASQPRLAAGLAGEG